MASHDRLKACALGSETSQFSLSHRPVKGPASAVFRSKTVKDLACILDLNPGVRSWSCGPPAQPAGQKEHIADFRIQDSEGGWWFLDAPDRNIPHDPVILAEAAAAKSHRYRVVQRSEIYDGFRLRNAKDLLRYSGHNVPLGDRMRLLSCLDENGSLTFSDCLGVIRETQPVAALASMILQGLLEVDLDEELLGPQTMVRRIRG
jgi:hypothetical protein